MDIITNLFYTHYDPSWVASNITTDDLSKRLSKQKEREKQELISELDKSTAEERKMKIEKQKVGIDNWFKRLGEKRSDYINSEEYKNDTEEERLEKIQQIDSENEVERDMIDHSQNKESIHDNVDIIEPIEEDNEGYISDRDMDEEGEESMYNEPDYQDSDNF